MTDLEKFLDCFVDFFDWDCRKQIDYLTYYLTNIVGKNSVVATDIQKLFSQLSIAPYSRLAQYLSESANRRTNRRYIKVKTKGYRLERKYFDEIDLIVKNEPTKVHVSTQLSALLLKVKNSNEKAFLLEAIGCYKIAAYRATITLVWMLTIDHLQKLILNKHLKNFNQALSKNPDKKINKINNYDEFSELKESKLIELSRASGVISNDIRKILDEKLGIRNSAAHPSEISFTEHKTTEFILDLINNIILKYEI